VILSAMIDQTITAGWRYFNKIPVIVLLEFDCRMSEIGGTLVVTGEMTP
jgi:hypothetical protein